MLMVISPAKKLDYSEETRFTESYSEPAFLKESQALIKILAKKSMDDIASLMNISPKLASLNYERYQEFSTPFSPENAKQALLAFKGDVYLSFELENYTEKEFEFAQKHLRILSGLYGLLKPLDLIQPYRLEMGTQLRNKKGKNLYEFWGNRIAKGLNQSLAELGSETLVNLASNEYFKSVDKKTLNARIITPVFKEEREGKLKSIFLFAKQARGLMCDFAIKEKMVKAEDLKAFGGMGYRFREDISTDTDWIFSRES